MHKLYYRLIIIICLVSLRTMAQVPVNDEPCNAIPLTVGTDCNYVQYSNTNATASVSLPNPGCANYNGGDVWFSAIVPTSGSINFDSNSGVVTDGGMALYTGSCNSLILIACDNNGSANGLMPSISYSGLTPGTTVYIRFWDTGNNNNGTFSICAKSLAPCSPQGANSSCSAADPFCTEVSYNYCNTTNLPSIGGGGIYGCLLSTPNPAFYYMNVEVSGDINFQISQQTNSGIDIDVDYVCWGPFASQSDMCNGLSAATIVDCSYSTASIETANIPNANAGEWYMVLISNFSNQAGSINFTQTNSGAAGAGTTNCNILTATASSCSNGFYTVSGTLTTPIAPTSGSLTISNSCGGSVTYNAPFPTLINYTIPTPVCGNGDSCIVTAVYSELGAPTVLPTTFTSPSCNTFTAVPGVCNGGTYILSGTITTGCAQPSIGTVTISSSCGGSITISAPFSNPLNWSLPASNGNGGNCTVTALYSSPLAPIINPISVIEPNCCGANTGNTIVNQINGTQTILANGTTQVVLCPGGSINISSNGYTLPTLSGCASCNQEEMYAIYNSAGPSGSDPNTDPNWTGYFWTSDAITNLNSGGSNINSSGGCSPLFNMPPKPGFASPASPANTLVFVPITADDGDNDLSGSVGYDTNLDGCFDIGNPIAITFLNPIAFTPSQSCNGNVSIEINGGYPEFFPSLYSLTNTGAGSLNSTSISSGGTVAISGLISGQTYSFNINDGNGCITSFSGIYNGTPTVVINPNNSTICPGDCVTLNANVNQNVSSSNVTFSNSSCVLIPDAGISSSASAGSNINSGSWASSSINVAGYCGTNWSIGDVLSVCLNISHAWDADLNIVLQSPNGTLVSLSDDNGAGNDNYSGTCFSMGGPSITTGVSPFNGSYTPEGNFSSFNGTSINGTWTLWVADDSLSVLGVLNSWSITFQSQNTVSYSWSPSAGLSATDIFNPIACPSSSTTYSLTVTNSCGCTAEALSIINVSPPVLPTFASIGPLCQNSVAPLLPTVSIEGITGAWNPSSINTSIAGTSTYTFTPSTGQCALIDSITITIDPKLTPTFNPVAAICSGDILTPLPTTSLNGITGTWSPSLNNTSTTTYTFTPTSGLCANIVTLTITVNPIPTLTSASPSYSICSGSSPSIVLNGNPAGTIFNWVGSNATSGIGSPINNILTNTICPSAIVTYTVTPSRNGCVGLPINIPVTVYPKPTSTFTVAPSSVCVNQPVTITYTGTACPGSTFNWTFPSGNVLSGSGSGPYQVQWSAQNTYSVKLQVVSPTGACTSTTTTIPVVVGPQVVPAFDPVAPICAGDFLAPLPTTSLNGITGTWNPAINNMSTTTYIFTPDTGQCAASVSLAIIVNPNIIPLFNLVPPICTGSALPALPVTSLNFVTGTWSPAMNNTTTTTYTFTPLASCAPTVTLTIVVNPKTTPTFNPVASICAGTPLSALPTLSLEGITGNWSPALNTNTTTTYTFTPTAGQCANTATLTITVTPNITPTFTSIAPICAGDILNALPIASLNGINGSWNPALNNNATTLYTFTPTAGQCATTSSLTITVNPNIIPVFNPIGPVCFGSAIAALPTTSLNGVSGSWTPALNNTTTTTYTFTPFGSCAPSTTLTIQVNTPIIPTFNSVSPICSGASLSALTTLSLEGITGSWSPALNNTTTTTYTFTPSVGQCASITTLTINVNPIVIPSFNNISPICSGTNLTLPVISLNGISGTWSPTFNNTSTTTYTFTPDAGQCATTKTLTVTVVPNVTPLFTPILPICEGALLSSLPTASNNAIPITGVWTPALDNTITTTYTFTPDAGQCATTTTTTIIVNPNVVPIFNSIAPICEGAFLAPLPLSSVNAIPITGSWLPVLNNTTTTTYTFTPSPGQCASITTTTIIVNPSPLIISDSISICKGFSGTLNASGASTYSWSPNTSINSTTGSQVIVNPLASSTYTVIGTDINGCTSSAISNVTVYLQPSISITPANAIICLGSSIVLNANGAGIINYTWSPNISISSTTGSSVIVNPSSNINYTVVGTDANQCTSQALSSIKIETIIVPTFQLPAAICQGGLAPVLPTTSIEGITGTWSPSPVNNNVTTTYTFTPDNPTQCGTTATLTVTVNPSPPPILIFHY